MQTTIQKSACGPTPPRQLADLLERARSVPPLSVAIVEAADEGVLESVRLAREWNPIVPILIGDQRRIEAAASMVGLDLRNLALAHTASREESVRTAARLVAEGRVACVQKGNIASDILLRELLSKTHGVRLTGPLSHILYIMSEKLARPILLSDAGVIPQPDLEMKKVLIRRAVAVGRTLGMEWPKVALLSASEKVTERVPSSVDADELTAWWKMEGGEADVFGPMSLDLSLSQESAVQKKVQSGVAGLADAIIAPGIEAANAIYKVLTLYAQAIGAGVVLGAEVPILLTSRSDPPLSRVASIAVASCLAAGLESDRSPN